MTKNSRCLVTLTSDEFGEEVFSYESHAEAIAGYERLVMDYDENDCGAKQRPL